MSSPATSSAPGLGASRRTSETLVRSATTTATFDVVLLLGPLYHLPDRADRMTALREARRVLRPGGVLAVAAVSRMAVPLDWFRTGQFAEPQARTVAATHRRHRLRRHGVGCRRLLLPHRCCTRARGPRSGLRHRCCPRGRGPSVAIDRPGEPAGRAVGRRCHRNRPARGSRSRNRRRRRTSSRSRALDPGDGAVISWPRSGRRAERRARRRRCERRAERRWRARSARCSTGRSRRS